MSWSRTLKIRQMLRGQIEAGEDIALLFSDLRGFSSYAVREGDRAAYQLAQEHEDIVRGRINEYGIVVKLLGDGIMAAFESPLSAILAAVSIQRALRDRNARGELEPMDVGIGVASGTPVMTDIDFIGQAVNLAQRLSGIAKGGQILSTQSVRRVTRLPEDLRFVSLGERSLKGLGTEEVVEVVWLRERARISDARDRATLILTRRGTIVVELARDAKRETRDALRKLLDIEHEDVGFPAWAFQRVAARAALHALERSMPATKVAREQDVRALRLSYRRGRLELTGPSGIVRLDGVDHAEAKAFLRSADEARASAEGAATDGTEGDPGGL